MPFCKLPGIKYYNYEQKRELTFYCPEKPEVNGYCIFHAGHDDIEAYKNNKDAISTRLQAKISASLLSKQPLFLIGYFLPPLHLRHTFYKPVYFNHSRCQGIIDFSNAEFLGGADFSRKVEVQLSPA